MTRDTILHAYLPHPDLPPLRFFQTRLPTRVADALDAAVRFAPTPTSRAGLVRQIILAWLAHRTPVAVQAGTPRVLVTVGMPVAAFAAFDDAVIAHRSSRAALARAIIADWLRRAGFLGEG